MNYYFFLDVGEFLDRKLSDVRDVVVGQAASIKCPKHQVGNIMIYKWGKTSAWSGTKFIKAAYNYIVLVDGSLFFSHLKEKDVAYFNNFDVSCGMEANVRKDDSFTWSHIVKLNKISRKQCPKLKHCIYLIA